MQQRMQMQQQNMVMNPSGMPQRMMRANVNVQGGLRQVCKLIAFTITLHTTNYIHYDQSHCIEVAQGDIFMEQNMRFGLILGQLAIQKKNWGPIMIKF